MFKKNSKMAKSVKTNAWSVWNLFLQPPSRKNSGKTAAAAVGEGGVDTPPKTGKSGPKVCLGMLVNHHKVRYSWDENTVFTFACFSVVLFDSQFWQTVHHFYWCFDSRDVILCWFGRPFGHQKRKKKESQKSGFCIFVWYIWSNLKVGEQPKKIHILEAKSENSVLSPWVPSIVKIGTF